MPRARLERHSYPPARYVQADDGEFLHVAYLDHFHRIPDKPVGELGNVDECAFLDADIHESAKIHYVLDLAHHLHPFLEVLELEDALLEQGSRQILAGIAVGFLELDENIVQGRVADAVLGLQLDTAFAIGIRALFHDGKDFGGEGIILGMDPGIVEDVFTLGNFQEARALLEGLLAQARYGGEHGAGFDGPVRLAVFDDLLGQAHVDAGHVFEDGMAGRVEIDSHAIDYRSHHLVELLGELFLVDVVLILADAYALGIYLDEFG